MPDLSFLSWPFFGAAHADLREAAAPLARRPSRAGRCSHRCKPRRLEDDEEESSPHGRCHPTSRCRLRTRAGTRRARPVPVAGRHGPAAPCAARRRSDLRPRLRRSRPPDRCQATPGRRSVAARMGGRPIAPAASREDRHGARGDRALARRSVDDPRGPAASRPGWRRAAPAAFLHRRAARRTGRDHRADLCGHRRGPRGRFDAEHRDALAWLATQAGIAFGTLPVFDEVRRLRAEAVERTARLALIDSIQQGLASKLELQSVIDLVGNKLLEVFETSALRIDLLDRERGVLTIPFFVDQGRRYPLPSRAFARPTTPLRDTRSAHGNPQIFGTAEELAAMRERVGIPEARGRRRRRRSIAGVRAAADRRRGDRRRRHRQARASRVRRGRGWS